MTQGSRRAREKMSLDEDKALLRAWREGHQVAGKRLVNYHFEWVSAIVLASVRRDLEAAREIIQATFEVALKHKRKIEGGFGPYVRGVAHRKVLEHFRKQGMVVDALRSSIQGGFRRAESLVLEVEHEHLAVKALRQLTEQQQDLMYLRYAKEMKLREIAQVKGMSVGRVDGVLRAAKARLRQQVKDLAASKRFGESTLVGLDSWLQARETRDDDQAHKGLGSTQGTKDRSVAAESHSLLDQPS